MQKKKSLYVTYLLWLLFGWFGLHHFYLGRDGHAFVWWSTFGGVFLLGWVRDLWRIPTYVADANEDVSYMNELTTLMRIREIPPFTSVRFFGQLFVGYFYGSLFKLALPSDTLPVLFADIGLCLAVTWGVYLVGNIGHHQARFLPPFLLTLSCCFFLRYIIQDEVSGFICTFISSITLTYFRQFRHTYKKEPFCKRIISILVCMLVIIALWTSFFYFNAEISTEEGEKIKVRDAVNHFFKSAAWMEFKHLLWKLYQDGYQNGWKNLFYEFTKLLDPKNEVYARKTLGITENTTTEEIKKVYKQLVRKWHPDKHKENKESAQVRFIEIQNAYDILMSKRSSTWREDKYTNF